MARKLMAFSDLSDREVDEAKLVKLVVQSHPTFDGTPVLLEVLSDEIATLPDLQADVVTVSVEAPDEEPVTYHLLLEDFDALATASNMEEVLANAQKAKKASNGNGDAAKVRAWAQAQKLDVPNKGRIPGEIQAKYDKAHASK